MGFISHVHNVRQYSIRFVIRRFWVWFIGRWTDNKNQISDELTDQTLNQSKQKRGMALELDEDERERNCSRIEWKGKKRATLLELMLWQLSTEIDYRDKLANALSRNQITKWILCYFVVKKELYTASDVNCLNRHAHSLPHTIFMRRSIEMWTFVFNAFVLSFKYFQQICNQRLLAAWKIYAF